MKRDGMALLVCLFVMALTSVILIGMFDTATSRMAALRNTIDYERALYLAGAGVHHALAELEADFRWRGNLPITEFPAGSGETYYASATDGGGTTVIVSGVGSAGAVTRRLQVTVELGG